MLGSCSCQKYNIRKNGNHPFGTSEGKWKHSFLPPHMHSTHSVHYGRFLKNCVQKLCRWNVWSFVTATTLCYNKSEWKKKIEQVPIPLPKAASSLSEAKKMKKTSLKAFSHQRRAKPFNTLRSKADSFEKKPFLAKKPLQIWHKYFWTKSSFCRKAITAKKPFLAKKFY